MRGFLWVHCSCVVDTAGDSALDQKTDFKGRAIRLISQRFKDTLPDDMIKIHSVGEGEGVWDMVIDNVDMNAINNGAPVFPSEDRVRRYIQYMKQLTTKVMENWSQSG